jgi:tetratricopeptide (TPR) repeat protein
MPSPHPKSPAIARTGRPASQKSRNPAAMSARAAVVMAPDDAGAHNGLANVALMRGDYDSAVAEGEVAVAAEPDYREAIFDLAQSCYWKIQEQEGDAALPGKALQTYKKLLEAEIEDPRLPQSALSYLQELYAPVIESVAGGN